MPISYFILLILGVVLAAGVTVWGLGAVSIPLFILIPTLLIGAAAVRYLNGRDT